MTKKEEIIIRIGTKTDLKAVYGLIHELAIYEHEPNEPSNPFMEFEKDYENACFELIVAEFNKQIIGITLFHPAYSSWKGRTLYLDDFIISADFRGAGIGKLLFDYFIEEGKKRSVNQIRWHVLDWNEPAIGFYKKYPCTFDSQWITCKLEKEKLI